MRVFWIVVFFMLSVSCSTSSVRGVEVPLTIKTRVSELPDAEFPIVIQRKLSEPSKRTRDPMIADIRTISGMLREAGVRKLIVDITNIKNAKGDCGGCGFSLFIVPEFRESTIAVTWLADYGDDKPVVIAEKEALWKETTSFFLFPFGIYYAIQNANNGRWDSEDGFGNLAGAIENREAFVALNRQIVADVYDGKIPLGR